MGETHVNEPKSIEELMGTPKETTDKKSDVDRLSGLRKKTDLSDIILEKENSTNARNKKIILGAASLVLLFLVFLILSKMINSSSEDKNTTAKADTKIELKDTDSKKSSSSDMIPVKNTIEDTAISDTDQKFEEMVRKLREEDAKENDIVEPIKVATPKKEQSQKPKETIKKTVEKKVTPKVTKPVVQNVKVTKPKKEQKIIITEVKQPSAKKHKTYTPPKKSSPKVLFAKNSGYYIQVGATTSPTPNRFLVSKIRANGYSYITHPIIVKGRKFYKVLIGPFPSKDAAKAKLPRVKATINPQAFLYHLR